MKKIVVVTGASSGIGKAVAEKLREEGHVVYGTSRTAKGDLLALDVCSPESVNALVAQVLAREGRIDVLVNNAGFATAGPAEEMTLDEARAQFETNFFGVVAMTNAVLPGFRARKSGQVITVSSLGGLTGIPFQAFYSASKHAVEGYLESLSWEVAPLGVRMHLVEPGFMRTDIESHLRPTTKRFSDYDRVREVPLAIIREKVKAGAPPRRVAVAVAKLVSGRSRKFRTRVGSDAVWVPRLKRLLPHSLFSKAVSSKFGV